MVLFECMKCDVVSKTRRQTIEDEPTRHDRHEPCTTDTNRHGPHVNRHDPTQTDTTRHETDTNPTRPTLDKP